MPADLSFDQLVIAPRSLRGDYPIFTVARRDGPPVGMLRALPAAPGDRCIIWRASWFTLPEPTPSNLVEHGFEYRNVSTDDISLNTWSAFREAAVRLAVLVEQESDMVVAP